jgi:hypothetical protein
MSPHPTPSPTDTVVGCPTPALEPATNNERRPR